jgi:hypothetical protein
MANHSKPFSEKPTLCNLARLSLEGTESRLHENGKKYGYFAHHNVTKLKSRNLAKYMVIFPRINLSQKEYWYFPAASENTKIYLLF